ncbi:MAG: hypothetical protein AB7F22_05395 [Reyranella sp.]|uniref:hypothetical protein n=1 Tax=Reyranella sp. TaxID=1929291 RepID=UPI003D0BA75A
MAYESEVSQVSDPLGGSGTVYQLKWRDTNGGQIPTFLSRNFGVATASVVEATYVWACNNVAGRSRLGFGVMRDGAGVGTAIIIERVSGSTWRLGAGIAGSWAQYGSLNGYTTGLALDADTYYKMHIKVVPNSDGTLTITATVRTLGDVDIGSYETTVSTTIGDYCGAYSTFDQLGGTSFAYIRQVQVQASGSTGYTPANLATSYVYTFVNDIGEESAPSPASATILRPDGLTVTVSTPVAVPSGIDAAYAITTKRIYRAATGNTGTQFLFVAEIPLATATYDDVLTDAQLGEVLESTGWDLPPDDLEGILALPNGIMVGFRRNQLCLSAQNRPHAWPPLYRLNTDTDIVGIANVDNTVVIGTESFVYVATGNDPATYSMSKFEVPYAAVSKYGFAYLTGIGVVFPGTDGLMAVQGVGQVRNLTDGVFTLRQWKALDPTTIRAVQHNDIYWLFARPPEQGGSGTPGQTYKAYALDMKPDGFGVIEMPFHASAAHVDPLTDTMYLVVDNIDEPDDPALPVPPTTPATIANGNVISQFEGDDTQLMTYRWKGKLWLLPYPSTMLIAQVKAEDYDNILFRVYGDGVQVDEIAVTSEEEFTLPAVDVYSKVEIEVLGTSTIREIQIAEDVMELI